MIHFAQIIIEARIFLLVDLRDFFFYKPRVGETKKKIKNKKAQNMTS